MDDNEFQSVNTALRVLPGYREEEFQRWYQTQYLKPCCVDETSPDYAIVNYDLAQSNAVILPASYDRFTRQVAHHLASTEQDDPWGKLDDDLVILKLSDQPHSLSGRALIFRIEFISSLLKTLFPHSPITPAEQRTLLQSLSGLTLRKAAELDQVSHETKKSQLNSVFQKTDIRRQQVLSNFLISHLLLEVAARHSRSNHHVESDESFFSYVDRYMGSYVRASVVQVSPNERIRLIEIGDPAGTPVVCVHHLGLINFNEGELNEIFKQGIRLICPLRHGALGPYDQRMTHSQQFEHALKGIDLAVSLIQTEKVTIIGMLSGCLYALQYLKLHPEKVKNLIFFAASYKPSDVKNLKSPFKRDLHRIAADHDRALGTTVSFLLNKIDQPDHLRNVMEESHNHGQADMNSIDELFSDKTQVQAMQYRLKHSRNSIENDLRTQSISDWGPLLDSNSYPEVHFIHGNADNLIPIEHIRQLVGERTNFHLHVIRQAGNWIFGKFTKQTFSIVSTILGNQ